MAARVGALIRIPARDPMITRLAQIAQGDDDEPGDDATSDKNVSPEQIQKYVAVYRAMQRDHSLSIEQAAAAQGLTVSAFRELEQRIESDDLARDDARPRSPPQHRQATLGSDAERAAGIKSAAPGAGIPYRIVETANGARGSGSSSAVSGTDRYFVTEDAKSASRRATASLARLTESCAPPAAS